MRPRLNSASADFPVSLEALPEHESRFEQADLCASAVPGASNQSLPGCLHRFGPSVLSRPGSRGPSIRREYRPEPPARRSPRAGRSRWRPPRRRDPPALPRGHGVRLSATGDGCRLEDQTAARSRSTPSSWTRTRRNCPACKLHGIAWVSPLRISRSRVDRLSSRGPGKGERPRCTAEEDRKGRGATGARPEQGGDAGRLETGEGLILSSIWAASQRSLRVPLPYRSPGSWIGKLTKAVSILSSSALEVPPAGVA